MKLLRSSALVVCMFLFGAGRATACDCVALGNMYYDLNQMYQDGTMAGDHIAMIHILAVIDGYGISAKVITEYYNYGTAPLPDTVKIWGDGSGITCRANPASMYHAGDTIIAVINPLAQQFGVQGPYESLSDYAISGCYRSSIQYRNDSVIGGGFAYAPIQELYSDFLDSLNSILTAPILSVNTVASTAATMIYPNPAQHDITLQSSGIHTMAQVRICDMNGRLVLQTVLSFTSGKAIVHTELPTGIYALQVTDETGFMRTEKLIIDR